MKTMQKIFNSVLLTGLLLMSFSAYSGSQNGTIEYVDVRALDGLIFFGLKGEPKINSPACATNQYWIIKNENSNTGKQQYAMLLTASALKQQVGVNGLDTCTRWFDGEDVNTIHLVP